MSYGTKNICHNEPDLCLIEFDPDQSQLLVHSVYSMYLTLFAVCGGMY